MAKTRKETQARNRAHILHVARDRFDVLGYADTTMRDLAAVSGLSTGALFSNWPDKAALYAEIYGHPPITPEQGRELLSVLKGEIARPRWLLEMAAADTKAAA